MDTIVCYPSTAFNMPRLDAYGVPEVIPVEMCYLGWQESLAQLANLVEPEIKE